ncbi:hypothetical protein NTP67_08300 [Providencia rettgeri]|uniref:hypothetical protein n=1 Tax=Providencia rettgeri TaxID=587 RepID=UPI002220763D|nr:hypothetical protein [Providencia rettgeri]ELR5278865.1 hypothetical protein [Providencia rettgeri]UYV43234.1 hypothetical protein NTP67_08300 [Providencia rettgeri]
MDTINSILSNSALGTVIGIIGLIAAILIYVLTRKIYKISSCHEFSNLINKNHSKLPQQISVMYDGSIVENVSSSEFVIWNSGNSVITKSALATKEPLRIEFAKEIQILRYQIVVSNNPINNIELKTDYEYPNSILIDFDFIEKNEGARIEILHTGNKSDIREKGKLIGVKSIFSKQKKLSKKKKEYKNPFITKALDMVLFLMALSLPLMILVMIIYSFVSPEAFTASSQPVRASGSPWMTRIMGSLVLFIFAFQFISRRPPYPSSLKKGPE